MNCEGGILQQAAQMTGAKIIKHLDDIACWTVLISLSLVQNPQEVIGSCGLFVVRDYRTVTRPRRQSCYVDVGDEVKDEWKNHARNHRTTIVTYCCFECCDVSRGCTVLLRGGNEALLQRAHEILVYLIKVRLSLDREISLYINVGVTSTSLTVMKEPILYVKTPRLLASSPCVVFGR